MNDLNTDQKWMELTIKLAQKAARLGEVPVAAIVVGPEGLLAKAINSRERHYTPLGHAELLALHRASQVRKNWRLDDCTLYVTLEPCLMCAGAIQQARIARVVYGTPDPKAGAVQSVYQVLNDARLNHQAKEILNLGSPVCSDMLSQFFENRRAEKKITRKPRTRATTIVIHEDHILGFYAQDPTSLKTYFFLPGGKIENGESPLTCAQRETLEETGHQVVLDEQSKFVKEYNFFWDGEHYSCSTHFFAGTLDDSSEPHDVKDANYHQGVGWIHIKEAAEIFSYSPAIAAAVQKVIKNHKKKSTLR